MAVDAKACRQSLLKRQQVLLGKKQQRSRDMLAAAADAARRLLPAYPQVQRAFLFGSALQPAMLRNRSDIDIAIEGRLSAADYFGLWRELELALPGHDVDLVELVAEEPFSHRIRSKGRLIYERTGSDA